MGEPEVRISPSMLALMDYCSYAPALRRMTDPATGRPFSASFGDGTKKIMHEGTYFEACFENPDLPAPSFRDTQEKVVFSAWMRRADEEKTLERIRRGAAYVRERVIEKIHFSQKEHEVFVFDWYQLGPMYEDFRADLKTGDKNAIIDVKFSGDPDLYYRREFQRLQVPIYQMAEVLSRGNEDSEKMLEAFALDINGHHAARAAEVASEVEVLPGYVLFVRNESSKSDHSHYAPPLYRLQSSIISGEDLLGLNRILYKVAAKIKPLIDRGPRFDLNVYKSIAGEAKCTGGYPIKGDCPFLSKCPIGRHIYQQENPFSIQETIGEIDMRLDGI